MASLKAWWLKGAKGVHGRGRQRKAPSARSRQVRLRLIEELEPRVVLTGFINYTAPPLGSDLTLRVANVGGAADLQLFNDATSSVIQQVTLNQAIQVQITGADKASDLLTVDLSYAGSGTPEPIAVQFAGGLPATGVTDKVTIGGAGAQYEPSTFTLKSDSPVFVTGNLQTTGDISLTAGQQSAGTVTAPGVITANAAAGITVNGSLTGHNITLAAQSTINVNSQSASLFNGLVKAGLVSSSSGASVQVQGGTLTASGNLSLTATSNVTVALSTAPSAAGTTNTDAALSTSDVASTATVAVSGGTLTATSGTATVAATNTVNVTTTADGSAGGSASSAKGGTAAVTVLSGDTDATVSGGTVSASGVNVSAADNRTVTTVARSTKSGATAGSPNPTQSQQTLTNYGAKTPDGGVNVAGAVAVTALSGDANARVIGGSVSSSMSPLAITASAANHPTTTADGSPTQGASGTGVGVAVAIGQANANSLASLGGTASVTAPAVNVSSLMPTTVNGVTPASQFSVAATSGQSVAFTGVAGSLAIDVTSAEAKALVEAGSNVNVHGANLTLSAQSTTSSPASATPEQVSGQSVGVGASVAINVPAAGARAAIENNTTLAGAHNLTLSATGNHTATTDALAGAAGGTAVSGALSLAIPSGATEAAIVTGPALTITGGLTVTTDRTSSITTRVDSASAAPGVAVGASTALTIANESAASSVGRNVTTGASTALIHAEGHGTSNTTALSSASGANPGTTTVNTLLGNVASFATGQGWVPGTVTLPLAATPDGKVGVAGAIAVNLASLDASAQLLQGATLQVAGGALTVTSLVTYGDSAMAAGTAVNTATGIAGAVAINDSKPTAEAIIAGSAKATNITVTATASGQTGATADSGQGSTNVGVAGALALNLAGASSQAAVAAGGSAVVKGSTTGNVVVQATTTVAQDTATADAKASGFAKTGVGASVALDIPGNAATADVAGTVTSPNQVTVFASGSYNSTATAAAGATGGTATAPALALDVSHDSTTATIGAAAVIAAGGQMLVRALHRDSSTGLARGDTAGSGVAIGAALGLDIGLDSDVATIAGKVTQSGPMTIVADLGDTDAAQAISGAKGAGSGGMKIDNLLGGVVSFGKSSGWLPSTASVPTASTPNGDLAVAAAAAVNVDLATETATIASGGSVVSTSPLLVNTLSQVNDSSSADGSPADGSALGIGAALAINVARPSVEASIAGAATAPSINVKTQMSGSGTNSFTATATSGAGQTNTGVAGALAINVAASQSTAAIEAGATLTLGGGSLVVNSVDVTTDSATAGAKAANPVLGLGASIATNVALNESHAYLGAATITGENAITVQANGTHKVSTQSNAGANVPTTAAAAAVAAAFSGDQTIAEVLAAPTTLVVPGTLTIDAIGNTTITTTANGNATGGLGGVGAAIAVGVDREIVTAQLARNANVHSIQLNANAVSPTVTNATASSQGGNDLGQSVGAFINALIGLVDPGAGGPSQVTLPLVSSTLTAIQNQTGLPLTALSLAADVAVSAVLPQTLAQIEANTALTSTTPVTIQTSVTANPITTANGSATGNTVAANLSLAANYAGGNNQVAVGAGASITAPAITLTAGGPGAQSLTAKAAAGAGSSTSAACAVALNAGSPTAPNTVQVTLASGSSLTATTGDVSLNATSDVTTITEAGGGAVGQSIGVGASIAGTFLQEESNVGVAGQVSAPAGNVFLNAIGQDTLEGASVAGSVARAAIDAAVRADILDKTVEAHIDAGANVSAFKDVVIDATSTDTPQAVSAGLGLGAAAVSAAATAVALNENTWAFITGATVRADDNVLLLAKSTASYDPLAATGSLGLIGGIGLSGTLFYKAEDAQAYITGGASVDALAQGAADAVDTGTVTEGKPNTSSIHGVSLEAINFDSFKPIAGAVGGGVVAAVQGSGIATIINNKVSAYISGGAKVNQNDAGAANSQLVNLLAWDDTTTDGVDVSLATALGLGVSATFDYTVIAKDTEAYIGSGALVSSNNNVQIQADSTENLSSFAGSFNLAGGVSAAASGALHTIQDQTKAHTDQGAVVDAKGSVLVLANSNTTDNIIAVVGAAGTVGAEATYSNSDIGGATFGGIHIASLSVGGTPGLTSAAVNGQVTAPTLNVSSTSTSTPSVESVLFGGGLISASAAAPTAQTSLQTSASLGSSANVNVTTLTGPMASSTNTPSALDVHVNAGLIAGAALLPDAVAGGGTSAFVAEGATVVASSLNVVAQATNVATVTPIQISAGVLSGGYADPQASTSQDVEAYIGPAYGVSPNPALTGTINVGHGTVTVNAQTLKNQATVDDFDIIAGAVGVGYVHPQATAGGEARAHIGGKFNITASAVNADGTSTNTATTDVISIDASAVSINLNVQGAITSETTEAYVGTKADLTVTGGALGLQATSTNTATAGEQTIQVSFVGVASAKSQADAGGSTNAYVQEGATITATGLSLSAKSTNTAEANPLDIGVGAVQVTVAHPLAETTHTTEVYIGPEGTAAPTAGDSGKISVGSGSVTGTATSTSSATVDPVDISVTGVNVSVLHPEVTAGGSTLAHLGGTFAITAGTVNFAANSTSTATSKSVSVEVSGVSVNDAIKSAQTNDRTDSFVGTQANLTITGASLTLGATSNNTATAGATAVTIAGVPVSLVKPAANADGATDAYVGEGAVLKAQGLSATATSTNSATASVQLVVVGGVSVALIQPTATTDDDVQAYVGPASGDAPNPSLSGNISVTGAVTLAATSHDSAQVDATNITIGAINVRSVRPVVTAGGETDAHLGGNGTISASSVNVTASAPNTQASTQTFSLDIGALNAAVTSTPITAEHTTDAFVAPDANFTINGPLVLHATSGNSATANTQDVSIGAIQVASITGDTVVGGATTAFVGDGAVLNGSNISLLADSTNHADATQNEVGVSLLGIAKLDPEATDEHQVQAYVGSGSTVTATGTFTVSATETNNANATSGGDQVNLVGVADVDPKAIAQGDTTATIAGTVNAANLNVTATATRDAQSNAQVISIDIGGGGSATADAEDHGNTFAELGGSGRLNVPGTAAFDAISNPSTTASGTGGGGGIINGAALAGTTTIDGNTNAFADNNAIVNAAGTLQFEATDTATGSANAFSGNGGVFASGGANATANISPVIQAYIGNSVVIKNVTGNITIQADSVRAQGDATSQVDGGGAAFFGAANSTVNSNPTVVAYIGTGSSVIAAGNVTVSAVSAAQGSGAPLGNTFNPATAVSVQNDTITFPSHGLVTGDVVTYNANGSTPIGTPGGPLRNGEFDAIVVNPNVLMLGATFSGAAANTGDLFNPQPGVDANGDVIRFATPDNFQTGDAVEYDAKGNTFISSSINETGTYYVRVLDPYTIELFTTLADAMAPASQFDPSTPGAVNGSTITLPGSTFTSGEAVTYDAPAPSAFSSEGVDVDLNGSHQISGDDSSANNIYLGTNNGSNVVQPDTYVTGEAVTYEVQPGKTALGGLTNGTTYYIIQDGGYAVQLASSYANAMADHPITLTPDRSSAGEAASHELVPAPIGGLASGQVYYVRNASGDTFQLSSTPTGPILSLNVGSPADIKGMHSFHKAGILFNSSSGGTQDLYINFTTNPAGNNDELLGPGGVSLRTISPPPGNGISASSAQGGEGGLVASASPDAETNVTANVQAYVTPRLLDVGGNLSVITNSTANTSAHADNAGGGLVFGGDATAGTSFQNENSAYVGSPGNTPINADGVNVIVGGEFQLNAVSSLQSTNVSSNADGGGLFSSVDAESNSDLDGTTQAVVGQNATIQAQTVSILANLTGAQGNLTANATAGGLFGSAKANTNGTWDPTVVATIAPGGNFTAVTGNEGVDIRALTGGVHPAQHASAAFYGIGPANTSANITPSLSSEVQGGTGATVTAGPRILPGPGVPASYVTPLQQPAGYPLLALYVDASSASGGARLVDWNSNAVILSGPNPDLLIDANGNIVRAINVSVDGGQRSGTVQGTVTVDPITNDDRGQVLLRADNSGASVIETGLPTGPLFTFRETFQTVSLVNQSAGSLALTNIQVVNTTPLVAGNQVTLDANAVKAFQFSVNHDFKPTTITVEEMGQGVDIAPRIYVDGVVNNPIGVTTITNLHGDILTPPPGALSFGGVIITDSFAISAPEGSIGSRAGDLQLDVVDSDDGPTDPAELFRTADAGTDADLIIQGEYREGTEGGLPPSGYAFHIDRISAGDDANVILDEPAIETTVTPFSYEVRVDETPAVFFPDIPNPMTVVDHFRPGTPGSTPTVLPIGIFGTATTTSSTIPFGYDFGSATDTSTGLFAQDDISVTSFSPAGITIYGYYHLGPGGAFFSSDVTNDMFPR